MGFKFEAACGCNIGKVRKNNEDNFYFDRKCLKQSHTGLRNILSCDGNLKNGTVIAVFDGMGGEDFGEMASFRAARTLQLSSKELQDYFVQERTYLKKLINDMNDSVLESKKEIDTNRMGTTVVMLYFSSRYVYLSNVGDSRAYRLRDGEFSQISKDHVANRPGHPKAALTQYLGIDPDDILLEPFIAKGDLKKGDYYLLCSDGLTDMLTNIEISHIIHSNPDIVTAVEFLIGAALDRGGRDNITAILFKIL